MATEILLASMAGRKLNLVFLKKVKFLFAAPFLTAAISPLPQSSLLMGLSLKVRDLAFSPSSAGVMHALLQDVWGLGLMLQKTAQGWVRRTQLPDPQRVRARDCAA